MIWAIATIAVILLAAIGIYLICVFVVRWLRDHTSFQFQASCYLMLLVLLLLLFIWRGQRLSYKKEDLETIVGVLREDPSFTRGMKGSRYLEIRLIGERCMFRASSSAYHVLRKKSFESDVRQGDSVFMSILKRSEMNLIGRLNYERGSLEMLELWTRKQKYISLADVNRFTKEKYPSLYVFYFLPVGFYCYWFIKRKQGKEPWPEKKKRKLNEPS